MKKIILLIATLCLFFGVYDVRAESESVNDEIRVCLDGERLEFDVPPMIIDDRTMVPMRVIFEALGAPVRWYEHLRQIHTQCYVYDIIFRIDNPKVGLL